MYTSEKLQLIKYGKKLIDDKYTLGTGGNLSLCIRNNNIMLITPSGISFNKIGVDDIVVMRYDGEIIEGTKKPSSEWRMHGIMYELREDLNCIIHAHTVYSTAMAMLRKTLPASHYMLASGGNSIKCADYASFGTEELAKNAFEAMKNKKAVLLANHGVLVGGLSIKDAYNVLEQLEYCAKVHIISSSIGTPVILDDREMNNMHDKFQKYGQPK